MINNICLKCNILNILLVYYTFSCTWSTSSFKTFLEIFLRIFFMILNQSKTKCQKYEPISITIFATNDICLAYTSMAYRSTFCSRSLFSNDWRTHTFYIRCYFITKVGIKQHSKFYRMHEEVSTFLRCAAAWNKTFNEPVGLSPFYSFRSPANSHNFVGFVQLCKLRCSQHDYYVRSLFRKLRLARYVYHGGETLPDAHTRHCLASYMAIVKLVYNLTVIISCCWFLRFEWFAFII